MTAETSLVSKMGPRDKRKAVEKSFALKVERMRTILNAKLRGQDIHEFWPRTLATLAVWTDPPGGLLPWKSKRIASPGGPHPTLYNAFIEVRAQLMKADKPPGGRAILENAALRREVRALAQQNARLEAALRAYADALELKNHGKALDLGVHRLVTNSRK